MRVSDLGQGMVNLRRRRCATAQMELLPGQDEGESDVEVARGVAKKGRLGAWRDGAGRKASGRDQAGG
ncbi:ShlB/FhaC/HecB family hemolysin secretion/activation protein, partial [Klebsiella variicola]|nr:ShlB/FhaC/HecB family hemolysin secretion/activation protein [Klebsiella variicola]